MSSIQDYPHAKAELAAISQDVKAKHNEEIFQSLLNIAWLRDCDANRNVLLGWSGIGVLTLEACEALVRSTNRNSPTLVWTSREELGDEILALLPGLDEWSKKQFINRLGTKSLMELRKQLRDLKFRAAAKESGDEKKYAKEFIKSTQPETPRFPGFPQLLSKIFVKEKFQWVATQEYLYSIAMAAKMGDAHALFDLKRYSRIYGAEQVNFWISKGAEQMQAQQLQQLQQ